jgi:uncharacterized DUF497 family protein
MMAYDPNKDRLNQTKHNVSLAFGVRVMADPHSLEAIDDRFDYGEERWNVVGMVDGIVYMATYTDRADGAHFISVRRASPAETTHYFANR